MSTLSIRLPESLHGKLKEMSSKDGISINQFVTLAVAEKISALLTADYLEGRARRGNREDFDRVLSRVRDVAPPDNDRLPAS